MAETENLVWIRGPGFGCRALRAASAPCSVLDFIHRHCQDQVRFAIPGREGKEGSGLGARGSVWGVSVLLGFRFLRLRGPALN